MHATTPLAPIRRAPAYTEVAEQRLGRVKLWLGYDLAYTALHFVPERYRPSLAGSIRRLVHGKEMPEHEGLRVLIECSIESDDSTT